jgi:hypothetical protein
MTGTLRRCDYDTHQVEAALKHAELVAAGLVDIKTLVSAEVTGLKTDLTCLKNALQSQTAKVTSLVNKHQYQATKLTGLKNNLQSQTDKVTCLEKPSLMGELSVTWNADINKMQSSPIKTENSKYFSVHVPGAGEYKCYLKIKILEEGFVAIYMHVKEGPIFPVTVALAKFTCGCHSVQLHLARRMDKPAGYGFPKFRSDAQVEAAKTAEGFLPITAKIQLKRDDTLCI